MTGGHVGGRLTRRALLKGGGGMGLAAVVPLSGPAAAVLAVPADAGGGRFLAGDELATLRALVDRFIPGPPEDPDPGAVEAGCAEAIDALLGAFAVDPPLIYAGAPFSDRGGWPVNHFEEFLPLDEYEETAWRLRIEGSRGRPELEHNGAVRGYQAVYRQGLAALEAAATPIGFTGLPAPARDLILRTSSDPAVTRLVDVAFPHTLELMYGPPEYGGNRGLAAWRFTNYDGDVQPRGYTREQVENPDQPGLPELLPDLPLTIPLEDLLALTPLASAEASLGMLARAGGTLSGLEAEAARILEARDLDDR